MSENFSNISFKDVEKIYEKISSNVKEYRIERNYTQLDLALEIGIKSVAFYSNCENNKYKKHFNIEHLVKISKVFNVDICTFFKGVDKTLSPDLKDL